MNLIRYNMLSAQNQIIGASGKNVEGWVGGSKNKASIE